MSKNNFAGILVLAVLTSALIVSVSAAPQLTMKWVKNTSQVLGVNEQGKTRWGQHASYDFDGDGKKEIIFGTEAIKRVACCNYDGTLRWIWPTLDKEPWADMLRPACIADVNGDGKAEITFSARSPDAIASLTWDGKERFNFVTWKNNPGTFAGGPIVRDFYPDIPGLETTFGGKYWWAMLKENGEEIWQVPLASDCDFVPNAQDIDKDGEIEIIVISRGASEGLRVFSPKGVEEWRFGGPGVFAGGMWYQPTVCDINNDGEWEIIVGSADSSGDQIPTGRMHCLSFYGTELWRFTLPEDGKEGKNIRCQAAVGDVNKDGWLEVAFQAGEPGFFYLLDHSGKQIWKKNTTTRVGYGCSMADVNNDGNLEILLGAYDQAGGGMLYIWDKDGNNVFEPFDAKKAGYAGAISIMCPEVTDLDGDGMVDILWNWYTSTNMGYFADFTTGAKINPALMTFPKFGATPDLQGMPQFPVPEAVFLTLLALVPLAIRLRHRE